MHVSLTCLTFHMAIYVTNNILMVLATYLCYASSLFDHLEATRIERENTSINK